MEFAAKQGADALSLAMINEHTILKKWYESLGFKEIETKKFPHLTFTVCFMRMELKRKQIQQLFKITNGHNIWICHMYCCSLP
jgi:hypothetical protein